MPSPTRIVSSSAGSRADDSSMPSEMSVESALKLLGVVEGASFDEILRAKNNIIATCKDDQDAIAKVIPPCATIFPRIGGLIPADASDLECNIK